MVLNSFNGFSQKLLRVTSIKIEEYVLHVTAKNTLLFNKKDRVPRIGNCQCGRHTCKTPSNNKSFRVNGDGKSFKRGKVPCLSHSHFDKIP